MWVLKRLLPVTPVLLVGALWLCFSVPERAHAGGFRLLDQGAAATAQGAAFAAQADDPSALHYNPAGMTQLPGFQVYMGGNVVSGDTSFTSTAGARAHGVTPGTVANPPPSTFYLTSSFRDLGVAPLENLTVGIGLTAPFGLLISYPNTGPLSEVTTRAALPLLDIKPTAAYRLAPFLSFGAGLDIYTFSDLIGDGHAEQKRIAGPEFAFVGIPPGSSARGERRRTPRSASISACSSLLSAMPTTNPGSTWVSSIAVPSPSI